MADAATFSCNGQPIGQPGLSAVHDAGVASPIGCKWLQGGQRMRVLRFASLTRNSRGCTNATMADSRCLSV